MIGFIASLIVATLLSLYIVFSYYIISITSAVSWIFGYVAFVIVLAVAIDILRQLSGGKK